MSKRYQKTAAGHAEIQARTLPLSRPVRNLLLVINDTQAASYWLSQLRGITEADLAYLVEAGLIAEVGPAAAAEAAPAPSPAPAADAGPETVPSDFSPEGDDTGALWHEVQLAIDGAGYSRLYDTLTAQAKGHFGLMKGYRFALEVERCGNDTELQALARRFAVQLRDHHGLRAVRQFLQALDTPA